MRETSNKILLKDIKIVEDYFNMKYPDYIHAAELYETVDYLAGCCHHFIKYTLSDMHSISNIFAYDNLARIEHNMILIDSEELYNYYSKMRTAIRVLKKYYNDDGTLKEKYKNAEIEKEKLSLIGKIKARLKHYRSFY